VSFAAVLAMPKSATPRRRGRPVADRAERLRHIRAAYDALILGHSLRDVARTYGVSRTTAQRWTTAAPSYDDPEAIGLRRLTETG